MLFFRLVPRPPLCEEAVELADDVRELQHVCGLIIQRFKVIGTNCIHGHTVHRIVLHHVH